MTKKIWLALFCCSLATSSVNAFPDLILEHKQSVFCIDISESRNNHSDIDCTKPMKDGWPRKVLNAGTVKLSCELGTDLIFAKRNPPFSTDPTYTVDCRPR